MSFSVTLLIASVSACTVNLPGSPPPSEAPTTSAPAATPHATSASPESTSPTLAESPSEPPSSDELAQAVVQVVQVDESNEPVCGFGSGTLLDDAGTLLTNFHVIRSDGECQYSRIAIALTDSPDEPPELTYLADAYAVSPSLDLAVLRITSTLGGGDVSRRFPFVERGDSDQVRLSDEIDILGYPAIGGRTITYTEGKIAGFASSPEADGRAWLKTDGTISGGNSGGLGADASGRIVGVPTLATGNPGADRTTDCRRLQDTDGDDDVDEDDSCIPIGGFLNSLRPINLAVSLIEEAKSAEPIPVAELVPPDQATSAAFAGQVSRISFAADVSEDNERVGAGLSLPSGTERVCAFFDFSDMADGTAWEALWSRDGRADPTASLQSLTWNQGKAGDSWVCTGASDSGAVEDGLWELSLFFAGQEEPTQSGSVFVGDEHPVVSATFQNGFETAVCRLYVAPDLASTYESDHLDGQEVAAGDGVQLELPAGQYDLLAADCDGETLGELEDVEVTTDVVVQLDG